MRFDVFGDPVAGLLRQRGPLHGAELGAEVGGEVLPFDGGGGLAGGGEVALEAGEGGAEVVHGWCGLLVGCDGCGCGGDGGEDEEEDGGVVCWFDGGCPRGCGRGKVDGRGWLGVWHSSGYPPAAWALLASRRRVDIQSRIEY